MQPADRQLIGSGKALLGDDIKAGDIKDGEPKNVVSNRRKSLWNNVE